MEVFCRIVAEIVECICGKIGGLYLGQTTADASNLSTKVTRNIYNLNVFK